MRDLTAAREHALAVLCKATADGLPTLADSGYEGAGIGVFTPVKQLAGSQVLDVDTRTYNMLLRALRCLANAASPCPPAAGGPCSTSPPTPA